MTDHENFFGGFIGLLDDEIDDEFGGDDEVFGSPWTGTEAET